MSFKDIYHQLGGNSRVNGSNISFLRKYVVDGGVADGMNALQIGLIQNSDLTLIESEVPVFNLRTIPDAQAVFDQFYSQGMSEVITGALLANPAAISEIDYSDTQLKAKVVGPAGVWSFLAKNVDVPTQISAHEWAIPEANFLAFRTLALQRLSTIPTGHQAPAFIRFDGNNDYAQFSNNNTAGLLDWSKSWTVGITVTEFQIHSDNLYQSLFSSGGNHIMFRRGGTNQALYVTGNGGTSGTGGGYSHGANTWYPIEAGDRLLFTYDSATNRLKYYKGVSGQSSYGLLANLLVNATVIASNSPDDNFNIGKHGSISNSPMNMQAGLNMFVAESGDVWQLANVAEYMGITGEDFEEAGIWGDMTSYASMGEDVYPSIVDSKGGLTGGELIDGSEDDFVLIENP